MKIISGGQTGADRGGLDAAIELELEHGGWCPNGRMAEDGKIPDCYRLVETRSKDYLKRTELNVKEADVTLIFIRDETPTGGSRRTENFCSQHGKPVLVANAFPHNADFLTLGITNFLLKHKPNVVNIAGNRESKAPGIQQAVKDLMIVALRMCRA